MIHNNHLHNENLLYDNIPDGPVKNHNKQITLGVGITSCLGLAAICLVCGFQVVKHFNSTADYSILKDQLYYSSRAIAASNTVDDIDTNADDNADETASKIPSSVVVNGKTYYLVTVDGTHAVDADSDMFSDITKYKDSIFIYNGSWYATDDFFAKFVDSTVTILPANAGNGNESDHHSDNDYIVADVDGNYVYLVKKGDTLSDVSSRISYSVDEIAEYNHINDVNLIYAGEALRVPD